MENPFLQISVLENLFGYLSVYDLKRNRNVCQVWKQEAFRALRKRVCIDLGIRSTEESKPGQILNPAKSKLRTFLNSEESKSFTNFSFSVCEWNPQASAYFKEIKPSSISAGIMLHLGDEEVVREDLGQLEDLLITQAKTLSKLKVRLIWASQVGNIPESLMLLKYPQLKELIITYEYFDGAVWLGRLWASILKNAPKLSCLELQGTFDGDSNEDDEMWKLLSSTGAFTRQIKELKCVQLFDYNPVQILLLHRRLLQNPLPPLTRLCLPFRDSMNDQTLLTTILEKVGRTLEILEFSTGKETALSPIAFPVMENLRVLDAGNSQLSFPTIVPTKFPRLTDIRATYWDWVYTQENLPHVNYYWGTDAAHLGVTNVHIRFPDWQSLNLEYRLLENFEHFVRVLSSKFPNSMNFTFHNCLVADYVYEALLHFSEAFQYRMKLFRVASFSVAENLTEAPPPLEFVSAAIDGDGDVFRLLEELDLSTKTWPETWRKFSAYKSLIMSDRWIANLHHFENLRCLKLLWARKIMLTLGLHKDFLPLLEHLEFVGNLCVNRFERARVRRSRPKLTLIQRTLCYCDQEDWWYMNDPKSDRIFRDLFSETDTISNFRKRIKK